MSTDNVHKIEGEIRELTKSFSEKLFCWLLDWLLSLHKSFVFAHKSVPKSTFFRLPTSFIDFRGAKIEDEHYWVAFREVLLFYWLLAFHKLVPFACKTSF